MDSSSLKIKRKRMIDEPSPKENKKRIKDTSSQRSGKWTFAEENFANQLINDFERGQFLT